IRRRRCATERPAAGLGRRDERLERSHLDLGVADAACPLTPGARAGPVRAVAAEDAVLLAERPILAAQVVVGADSVRPSATLRVGDAHGVREPADRYRIPQGAVRATARVLSFLVRILRPEVALLGDVLTIVQRHRIDVPIATRARGHAGAVIVAHTLRDARARRAPRACAAIDATAGVGLAVHLPAVIALFPGIDGSVATGPPPAPPLPPPPP